jgi:hypothetical protein
VTGPPDGSAREPSPPAGAGGGDDPVVRTAIARYHDGLSDEVAAASQEMLARRLRAEGLYFGERPLCGVLRPRFLSGAQYRHIVRTSELIVRAMERVRVAAMADDALRAQFRLHDWEERLVHADPRLPVASPVSRLDAFFAPGTAGLQYTEYNAETPAGAAYNDVMARVFLDLPAMGAFRRSHVAVPLPAAAGQVQALLDGYRHWRGVREVPAVCILDWREVPTYSEFELYQRHLEAAGVPAFIGDPREAEYANGVLTVGGRRVTLIYKRVLLDELVDRCGLESPVVRAVQDGAVCMINPFRCKLLHKKASLAVVGDERHQHLLPADERAAVAAHVPWTRVVEERRTEHAGQPVDLVPYIADRRERFVLKPNDDYGGAGIVLGWTVTDSEWQAALRTALGEPYVVQERITLPTAAYPAWVDGRLHVGERMEDTAPFVVNGQVVDGCLSRIATDPLLNVTAGGGSSIPSFLVEAR